MYLYIGMDLTLWRGLSDLVGMSCFFLGVFIWATIFVGGGYSHGGLWCLDRPPWILIITLTKGSIYFGSNFPIVGMWSRHLVVPGITFSRWACSILHGKERCSSASKKKKKQSETQENWRTSPGHVQANRLILWAINMAQWQHEIHSQSSSR